MKNRTEVILSGTVQGRKSGAGRALCPSPPPHRGGGGRGTYTIIVNWQKGNNRFLAGGEEIRQRAWESERGDMGPSAPPTRVSPLAPDEDLAGGRGTAGRTASSSSLAFLLSLLGGAGVLWRGRQVVSAPVLL